MEGLLIGSINLQAIRYLSTSLCDFCFLFKKKKKLFLSFSFTSTECFDTVFSMNFGCKLECELTDVLDFRDKIYTGSLMILISGEFCAGIPRKF